jgi:hypothetical protein
MPEALHVRHCHLQRWVQKHSSYNFLICSSFRPHNRVVYMWILTDEPAYVPFLRGRRRAPRGVSCCAHQINKDQPNRHSTNGPANSGTASRHTYEVPLCPLPRNTHSCVPARSLQDLTNYLAKIRGENCGQLIAPQTASIVDCFTTPCRI